MALIKPQFELERKLVKKGVVKSIELQQQAIDKIRNFVEEELGFKSKGVVPSSIKGPKGNQEYLMLLERGLC